METETINKIIYWAFVVIGISILIFTGFKFWWIIGIAFLIYSRRFERGEKQ
jgi:hypothetical protein